MKCPLCKGEKKLGYLSSDGSAPPRLGECYKCEGTGEVREDPGAMPSDLSDGLPHFNRNE